MEDTTTTAMTSWMDDTRAALAAHTWCFLGVLSLGLALSSTGCRSFLRDHAMKTRALEIDPREQFPAANRYQEDLLYLMALAAEVCPLRDHYFPPEKRKPLEDELLRRLGQSDCTEEDFLLAIETYLGAFNNQHARIVDNPKPIQLAAFYPFRVHYVSNELFLVNLGSEYEAGAIGHRITKINGRAVADVEEKMFTLTAQENMWAKRRALESPPFFYYRPEMYRLLGLANSVSNRVLLEFADHAPVGIDPRWDGDIQWHGARPPAHPITARTPHQYDCQFFPEQGFAYFQFNACFDKTAILDGLRMVKPWVRPLVRAWLEIQFHRSKPFAVLNGIYDPDRPVLARYLTGCVSAMQTQGISNLILDLRHNGGGESALSGQLLYFLTAREDLRGPKEFMYNPDVVTYYDPKRGHDFRAWYLKRFGTEPPARELLPVPEQGNGLLDHVTDPKSRYHVPADRPVFGGRIVVLANENTGSAAADLTALMQDNRLGLVVGTPTGSNPTGPTGMTPFKLPRSRLLISLPTEYVERASPSHGVVFQPDHWVVDSISDLQTGRDAAFDKAIELLGCGEDCLGPLREEEIRTALEFLKRWKESGRQPGWSREDRGVATLESYSYFAPRSVTFRIGKKGGHLTDHLTLVRPTEEGVWTLRRAW